MMELKFDQNPQGAFNEWCIFQEPVTPPFPLYLDIIMLSDFITFILNIPIFPKNSILLTRPLTFQIQNANKFKRVHPSSKPYQMFFQHFRLNNTDSVVWFD